MKFEEETKFVVDAFQPELIAASTLVNGTQQQQASREDLFSFLIFAPKKASIECCAS